MSRFEPILQQALKLISGGRVEQARSTLARSLQKDPSEPWLNNAMAVTFIVQGQHQQAHYYASRAAVARPDNPEFQCTLGSILSAMGRHEEAVSVIERAIALDPTAVNPRLSIANALAGLDRHAEAANHCREALAHSPHDREITIALMQSLLNTGRVEAAMDIGRELVARFPASPELASWMPYAMNYIARTTPRESLEAHRACAEVIERAARTAPRPPNVTAEPDRTLRVGLVSPDLRTHSVAFFIAPLLRHADRSRMHLTCYSTAPKEDATSDRLRGMSDAWRHVAGVAAAELASRIRADKIDILIDLAGNTAGEKLAVFVHHPAPVQITYLGYPNTTGLACMEYRIVDSHTDPAGADQWCTETLLRLDPCFLCYEPGPETPSPANHIPSAANGHGTFGSFNTLIKLSEATVELWSRLLVESPGSRLLLKCRQLADPMTQADTIERFARRGVDPGRIEVLPAAKSAADHLALYSRIDVALDPIPYAGTTTTCEAMYMGVPVVTLRGNSHASRVGVSLLSNVGLDDLIAGSADECIAIARRLADDHTRRTSLRSNGPSGLRARMLTSPLCDGPGFARRFERMLRDVWTQWCQRNRSSHSA